MHMLEDSSHVNTCDAIFNTYQVRSGEQHNKDSHPVNLSHEYLGIIVSLTSDWCQNICLFELAIGKLRNYVLLLNRVGDDDHSSTVAHIKQRILSCCALSDVSRHYSDFLKE